MLDLDDYQKADVLAWATAFIDAHRETPPTIEEVWAFARAVVTVRKPQYACAKCKKVLTARDMLRPCLYCKFRGNHKAYVAIQHSRKQLREALGESRQS